MGDKSIACKECIFGNHERKTCYLESSCEVMHEWLREHDKEVRNKAIDDFVEQLRVHYAMYQERGFVSDTNENIIRNVFEYAEMMKLK